MMTTMVLAAAAHELCVLAAGHTNEHTSLGEVLHDASGEGCVCNTLNTAGCAPCVCVRMLGARDHELTLLPGWRRRLA
jgi:hypothetical protein